MTKVHLWTLSRDKHVLAGSQSGMRMYQALWEIAQTASPGLFILDFTRISVATSSFLRESVVKFRGALRQERPDLYPVVSNVSMEVEEELVGLLNQMGEALWVFKFGKSASKANRLIGRIDPKLRESLDLIEQGIGYDAATLWNHTKPTESIGITAWNNRLASLAKQGLVFESRVGKQKYFHPLHECGG